MSKYHVYVQGDADSPYVWEGKASDIFQSVPFRRSDEEISLHAVQLRPSIGFLVCPSGRTINTRFVTQIVPLP